LHNIEPLLQLYGKSTAMKFSTWCPDDLSY